MPGKLKPLLLGVFASGLISIIVVLALYFSQFHGKLSTTHDNWGQFGDFVGGTLNPLFAFLSFTAVALTLAFQYASLLQAQVEIQKNNVRNSTADHRSLVSDFLRRFELEEGSLEQLAIDIANNLILQVQHPNNRIGAAKFDAMLSSYEKGQKNVFMNYLISFFVLKNDELQLKIMNFADCSYGLQVEQYIKRFEGLLEEGRVLDEKTFKLLKHRTTAKLYDALKFKYDMRGSLNPASSV